MSIACFFMTSFGTGWSIHGHLQPAFLDFHFGNGCAARVFLFFDSFHFNARPMDAGRVSEYPSSATRILTGYFDWQRMHIRACGIAGVLFQQDFSGFVGR